eukprot:3398511-Amphidinium_carterae.1
MELHKQHGPHSALPCAATGNLELAKHTHAARTSRWECASSGRWAYQQLEEVSIWGVDFTCG